jgi:hypothetical protein
LPRYKFGIEHHGLYWHSEGISDRSDQYFSKLTHQNKALLARQNGIKLLQIWEYEWLHKTTLLESMIKHHFGMSTPINARKLSCVMLNNKDVIKFYDNNHLYGHRDAACHLALVDDEILMAMSLSRRNDGYEIIRMATKHDYSVRGGASRLLSYFIRDHSPRHIETFADLRYSTGETYRILGFVETGISKPNYFYYKGQVRLSRQQCQKHKLIRLLENFDIKSSESFNMFNHGFRRAWDAGHMKFILTPVYS